MLSLLSFLKKFWIFFALIIPALFFVNKVLKSRKSEYDSNISALMSIHQIELDKIKANHEEERKQHEENVRVLQTTLSELQKKYDDADKKLDEKQKKRTATIVRDYSNNPVGLAHELSRVTGFEVIEVEKKL